MAITIRKMDEIRVVLDWYKHRFAIATDAGALTHAMHSYYEATAEIDGLKINRDEWRTRAETAERILGGLEDYLRPALEIIQQRELNL
jgi:hypothetical protein